MPAEMDKMIGKKIHISGVVQGVGFRPFVFNLAKKYGITGWVRNTSSGVDIEIDGEESQIAFFLCDLKTKAPPLSFIDNIQIFDQHVTGFNNFEIKNSESHAFSFQPISPDLSICSDCLHEMFNENDRRYRYPFINCTNCGPRFTIINDMPYDRPKTTMAAFEMCPDCLKEYNDPENRRFHAQPVACPNCGPFIWLERPLDDLDEPTANINILKGEKALQEARTLLSMGKILAIKGLGGFHLACNANDNHAVAELRHRKGRLDKPFAVMMPDVDTIKIYCDVDQIEQGILQSPAHPIVLLKKKFHSSWMNEVAPNQPKIGVMLPYTPLHHLIMEKEKGFPEVLVMTSGNLSDEPICTTNLEAKMRLKYLADAFLLHNREIYIRADDSVTQVYKERNYPIRRSRGYSPFPFELPWKNPPLIGTGAELKNTFCVTHDNYAFLSQHIGDLENYEAMNSYEKSIKHFENIFRVKPEALACDMHPNYLATRYAMERSKYENIPLIYVQHHHAHIAALMAENKICGERKVIGVAFDGTGYGKDGLIWGGEFLVADYVDFERAAHLKYFPLPGGDVSIRRPSRIALAIMHSLGLEWEKYLPPVKDLSDIEKIALHQQLEKNINTHLTSSAGRLFDAIAALIGIRQRVNYEAQAAIELEAIADANEQRCYPFELSNNEIDIKPLFLAVIDDLKRKIPPQTISGKFHNYMAQIVFQVCQKLTQEYGVEDIALSGGVWQNITLLTKTYSLLSGLNCNLYIHQKVPSNDGGIALGQVAIAGYRMVNNRS